MFYNDRIQKKCYFLGLKVFFMMQISLDVYKDE
jgi:hypothetical protein